VQQRGAAPQAAGLPRGAEHAEAAEELEARRRQALEGGGELVLAEVDLLAVAVAVLDL
jgi:hypothetical protein